MEEQKTKAAHQKQSSNQEPQKEKDLLLPCPGLPSGGDKEGIWGMEQREKDQD